jgi:hypothetical protein
MWWLDKLTESEVKELAEEDREFLDKLIIVRGFCKLKWESADETYMQRLDDTQFDADDVILTSYFKSGSLQPDIFYEPTRHRDLFYFHFYYSGIFNNLVILNVNS